MTLQQARFILQSFFSPIKELFLLLPILFYRCSKVRLSPSGQQAVEQS